VGYLKNLANLSLSGCGFTRIPPQIAKLVNLEILVMSHNPLQVWVYHIVHKKKNDSYINFNFQVLKKLPKLTDLILNNCGLRRIPPGVVYLPALKNISLEDNNIAGMFIEDLDVQESLSRDGSISNLPPNSARVFNLKGNPSVDILQFYDTVQAVSVNGAYTQDDQPSQIQWYDPQFVDHGGSFVFDDYTGDYRRLTHRGLSQLVHDHVVISPDILDDDPENAIDIENYEHFVMDPKYIEDQTEDEKILSEQVFDGYREQYKKYSIDKHTRERELTNMGISISNGHPWPELDSESD